MFDLIKAEQLARRYGSSNCWTGTLGTLSAVILELVCELRTVRSKSTMVSLPPPSLTDCLQELHDAGQHLKLIMMFLSADATLPEDKKEILDAYVFNAAEKVTNVVMKLQEARSGETVSH